MELGKNIALMYETSLTRKAAFLARKKIITLVDEPDIRTAVYGISELAAYEDRDWSAFKRSSLFGDSGFVLAVLERHSTIDTIDFDAFYEELGSMEQAKVDDFLSLCHVNEDAVFKTTGGFRCLHVKNDGPSISVLTRRLMKYVDDIDFIIIGETEGDFKLRAISLRAAEALGDYKVTINQFAPDRYRDCFRNLKTVMAQVDRLMSNKKALEEYKFGIKSNRDRLTAS